MRTRRRWTGPECYPGASKFRFIIILAVYSIFLGGGRLVNGTPAPISVPVATEWVGDDGNWSPFTIRVGSPPQWVSVLPNTRTSETWVIGRDGCDDSMTCRNERGGLFLSNESSTWTDVGPYEIGYTLQLGQNGVADYGYDEIALDQDTSVEDQVLGIISAVEFWVGSFGLGITRANFTDSSKLSFLSTLKETKNLIPSHSYGYTAGAYNRLKGVPGSLTLGGVDRNRFVSNGVSFNLTPDYLPTVSIQAIDMSMNLLDKGDSTLIPPNNEYLFTIDSSTPFFWFPEDICDSIAEGLDLTYNETLQIYTYGSNASTYDALADSNFNFTFTLSDLPDSSNSVTIDLPFSALNHRLSYPFPNLSAGPDDEGVRYFPLRKANDSKQYTIGRAFLQESYLIVDYERQNFSISQAKFAADASTNTDIVEIAPYGEEPATSSSLSTGAKAGIGVGVSVFVIAVAVAVFFLLRRRKKPAAPDSGKSEDPGAKNSHESIPCELQGDRHHPTEAPTNSSVTRFELACDPPAELPGSEPGGAQNDAAQFKDSETYRLHNGEPRDIRSITASPAPRETDRVDIPPYSVELLRRIDNSDSDHSSPFPSPLPGHLTNEGSHSYRVSPVTGSGENSGTTESFLQANQTSRSPDTARHDTATESPSAGNVGRSGEGLDVGGSREHDQADSTPYLRKKFSWEE